MLLPGLGAPGGTGAAITESNQIKSKVATTTILVLLQQITKQTPENDPNLQINTDSQIISIF